VKKRYHAEIVGAGFAGLTAACALARRGWTVRVHERAEQLRTAGAGIYIYENGLRVLEAVGAYAASIVGAPLTHTREVRDQNDRLLTLHEWKGSRVYSIVRQNVINALAEAASRVGVEIVTGSTATGATPEGDLTLSHGRTVRADLIVAADGSNSSVRDAIRIPFKRKYLVDGCTRLLIKNSHTEEANLGAKRGTTIEYWSGTRRVLYTPCSEKELYVALTMLHKDEPARALPVRREEWARAFPSLEPLFARIGGAGRYDRFELIKLKSWSIGRVAIVGDAAHALPPNIGQGGGCAMMNALSLAFYLEQESDVPSALRIWEQKERPLTDHTQRVSYVLGLPTTWAPKLRAAAFAMAGRSKWLTRQRTRTALHHPTGT
jgi:2-polyprenyl-6-methoxyphenol hydroxylase-like FAD-dependent oxidoreductase